MVYLITAILLLVYLILAWFVGTLLHLQGARLWILRTGLAVLGIIGAAVFLWFYRKQQKEQRAAAAGSEAAAASADEIDLLIRDAESKLAASRLGQGARIGGLPVILLVGDPGTTKTSTLVHSGLEPELLSGQVYQNNNIVPTRSANVWFARRAIFVECGGRLLGETAKWMRLVRRLQPSKLGAVVGKSEQAPRAAVVCFDAEAFSRPGAAEAVAATARNLRARLGEISQIMGVNLPVYVLFTRMDRLPFFAEYVRNLSNEEATQVLGVTLPLPSGRSTGVYAEEETARLAGAFDNLFRSLANARPEFLSRENEAAKLPGIYEFPREFRKLGTAAVQFLVDLCRPSQLTVGPFLRGFYFSGVRPVIVTEVAPARVPAPERQAFEAASGATGMFHAGLRAQPAPPAPAPVAGARKVPQWLFLSHLFNDVVLADRVALGASGAGAKAGFLRRLLLVSAAALCLILSIVFLVSWLNNRELEQRALQAARGISAAESSGSNLASLEALRRLDTLRQSLETLTQYNREGAPWSYRWGLYAGNDYYPQVRRIYFDRFRQLLLGQSQAGLLEFLRSLPATPGPEYGPTYDTLKAYLITTSHHDKSTRMFLSPLLLNRWSANRNVDPERLQLAQRQFDFYSEELKVQNPFSSENDGLAVEKARRYLSQFAGTERVYQFMLAEAAKSNPAINFNRRFPGSAEVVVDTREVAGPFTKGGWDFMKNTIKNADRYFSGEQWVLGDQVSGSIDRARLEQQIRDRYYADFVAQWRAFLKSAAVVKYAGLQDAARKLNILSGNQSPLLALFWLVSQNTAVDDSKVASAFQPAQMVVPPGSVDRYIAPPNQNYMNALVQLQTSLEQIAHLPPGQVNDGAASQTLSNATAAKVTTRQVAQAFRIDPEAHVEGAVQKLMEDPITHAEALLRTLGPAELNAKGKSLCAHFRTLMSRYPFHPAASSEATVADVNGVFRKPDGALWAFYDANLQKLLPRQGSQYVPSPGGGVTLNPAFVSFFRQAAALSEALYAGGAQEPHLAYTLKPVPTEGIQSMSLRIDGQALTSAAPAKQFVWQGSGAHEVNGTVKFGGPDLGWANYEGLWAVFRFFADAEHWQPAGSGYNLDWIVRTGKNPVTLGGKPLTVRFDLDMAGAPPVFQKAYLARLACVSEVAR